MTEKKKDTIVDLIWIIPEIIGELFIQIFIPIMLLRQLIHNVEILSITGMLYTGVIYLLMYNLDLKGLHRLVNIEWRNKQ